MGPAARAWEARGAYRRLAGYRIFTLDIGPTGTDVPEESDLPEEPLLIVHGFPTSSHDFHRVTDRLAVKRRVLLLDLVGFGLSEKPDMAYTMALQADVVAAFVADAGVDRLALLTHDMGDTVGGELLARQVAGDWPVEITRRVLTNGSIYIEMAQLTAGQQLLLSLPDAALAQGLAVESLAQALADTMSPASGTARSELTTDAELVVSGGGSAMLPRTIRYIEERRRDQYRFTGAIESHPSPLGMVWGADDPIAVLAMVDRLLTARPATRARILDGVGHYPMLEAPDAFADAVEKLLTTGQ